MSDISRKERLMDGQMIISVGREFGSGGHVIAEELARRFELPLYDNNLLEHIAEEKEISHESLKKYDERPKNRLFSRTVRGYSNSMQENLANMQFDYLKKKAAAGESFVIVGRCSETILKGFDGLVTIFVLGDPDVKAERIRKVYGVSEEEARRMMKREDWNRKSYHNYYCKGKWGDSRNYDFSINSSRLGIDGTVTMLEEYIRAATH
jgi:cytidylate kinase